MVESRHPSHPYRIMLFSFFLFPEMSNAVQVRVKHKNVAPVDIVRVLGKEDG
jgi:hypothetical protein